MKNRHLRLILTLFAFAPLMFCFAFLTGCETQNPICSENYCVEGIIYHKSLLFSDETYSEVEVDDDAIFNAIFSTTPQTPILTKKSTLSDIVAHVAAGGKDCLEQTYTITGTVDFNFQGVTGRFLTIETNNNDITFFIDDNDDPKTLENYEEGETYTFTVFIYSVGRHTADDRKHQSIFSHLVEE